MTPWETVLSRYRFPEKVGPNPFIPHPLQIETINELAPNFEAGVWLDMGTGKTFVSTAMALYQFIAHGRVCLGIMPPVLVRQWGRWLSSITDIEGNPLKVLQYRGTPAKRAKLDLNHQFVIMGVQIFKRDVERLRAHYFPIEYVALLDEATFAGNINSDMHQLTYDFCVGRPRMLLSGTPANDPMDAYAMMKFTAPNAYRSRKHFENVHVDKRDFYGKPKTWVDLDVMGQNLLINSKRVLYGDMFKDVEVPLYDYFMYDLAPEHVKLYHKLASEEVLKLEDGGKVDATNVNKLRHRLGQIIVNWGHFAEDSSKVSTTIELIEDKLQSLGNSGKLLVFAHYKMTVRNLTARFAKYGAVAVNSEVSEAQRDENVQRFINDPDCKVIVVQYISGGKGLDGMQYVSHTILCAEPCQQPRDFHQAVARLARRGQKYRVHVMLPTARRTLQVRAFKRLVENDTLINQVVRNTVDLRKELFGDDENEE